MVTLTTTARPLSNYDSLKLFALLAMTIDHLGAYLFPDVIWLRVIGRSAAPIFCFLVGWNHSYRWRAPLLAAAVAMSGLSFLHTAIFPLNILWVILLGRLIMARLEAQQTKVHAGMVILAALIWLPIVALVFDYATVGFLWMLWGRQQRKEPCGVVSYMYAASALIGALIFMAIFMRLPVGAMLASAAVMVMTMGALQQFRLQPYTQMHVPLFAFVSRHALAYYVVHLTIIIGVSLILGQAPLGLRIF